MHPEALQRLSQPVEKCKLMRKQQKKVYDIDLFVTVQILEDTLVALSLGKLCEDHGCSYEWVSGQKPHLIKNDRKSHATRKNCVPIAVPGLSTGSSSSTASTSPTSLPKDTTDDSLSSLATRRRRSTSRSPQKQIIKMRTLYQYRETSCEIYQNG